MNANHFFTLCRPSFDANLADTYKCCLETCTAQSEQPHVCYSMCAQMFPNIKDRCAFEHECWRDGFYNIKCLQAKSKEIKECCVDKCQQYRQNPFSYTLLDCNRYCSDYELR